MDELEDAKILQSIETNNKLEELTKISEASLVEQTGTKDALKDIGKVLDHVLNVMTEDDEEEEKVQKVEIQGVSVLTLKGDKGDKGDTPTTKELISLIEPLIPEPIKGKDGKDYILTVQDKKDIALKIKVPVVEKVVEKTETIIEKPVTIDNTKTIIKEVAKYEEAAEIVKKINTLAKSIDWKTIKNAPEFNKGGSGLNTVFTDGTTIAGTGLADNPLRYIGGGGGGAVDSVNGQTGVVVLDTSGITDTTNARYVTDADLVVIGNTSGINTGDQTSIVGITGTKAQFDTSVTDGNFLYVGDITQYTDEMAQDAVGNIMTDSSEIDFTYSDGVPSITASIVAGSIDESKLDASVNASLDLADTAVQPAGLTNYFNKTTDDTDDITVGTTNKFATAAEKTKLGFISVTQAVDLDTIETNANNVPGIKTKTDFITVTQNVDLDQIESDTVANNAKVSNATHTGDATGATTLTVVKIQGKDFPTLGVGDDQKYPKYNHGTNAFVMTSIAGGGDVVGPASSTDNSVALFDGTTGKLIKSNANLTFNGNLTVGGGGYLIGGGVQLTGGSDNIIFDAGGASQSELSLTNQGVFGFSNASFKGNLDFSGLSADRLITFQDQAGTVALTSDIAYTVQTISSDETLTETTGEHIKLVDATSADTTITLPTAVGNTAKFTIKKVDSSANLVVTDCDGTETIDGDLTKTINFQWTTMTIISNGTNWYRVN